MEQNSKTREGIEVKVGQVWEDLDKRMKGRQVLVIRLWPGGKCDVAPHRIHRDGKPRQTTISISRMHKHSTGYRLIKDI